MPQLRAFARSLTGGDIHLADDLVQDTIVNALQAQSQFTPGTNLKAWMFTILRNRFRSLITRKHVKSEVQDDDLERKWWTPATQETGLEVAAFKRAFARLSGAHREVLVLVGVHGMRYEQIAEICGCEVGTVKSRVNRARTLLKKMLYDGDLPVEAKALPAARTERAGTVTIDATVAVSMLTGGGPAGSRPARAH
ncbi:MAG: sigma-70 family RNA polymerase sigma factor [Geminicoccaceae bacterium]|nr:sigma-70 family RNA polymerase sigma factor [Geminicoccaceae bacterium]